MVQVGLVPAQSPVQARVPGGERPEDRAAPDGVALRDVTSSGSYVVRSPFACATLTTPRPASTPAKRTTPGAGGADRRADPRRQIDPACPASHGWSGGSNPRLTTTGLTGADQRAS